MHGPGVMNRCLDPFRFQSGAHGIAILNVNNEQVADALGPRIILGHLDARPGEE